MRQVVFADDDFDIHAEIVFIAQNLNHPSARVLRSRGPIGDLHVNDNVFKIAPVSAAGSFRPQDSMLG